MFVSVHSFKQLRQFILVSGLQFSQNPQTIFKYKFCKKSQALRSGERAGKFITITREITRSGNIRTTLYSRFSRVMFLILRSVREMVALFLSHFLSWPASNGLLLFILIPFTTYFETPAIHIFLSGNMQCCNNGSITLHFSKDMAKLKKAILRFSQYAVDNPYIMPQE